MCVLCFVLQLQDLKTEVLKYLTRYKLWFAGPEELVKICAWAVPLTC